MKVLVLLFMGKSASVAGTSGGVAPTTAPPQTKGPHNNVNPPKYIGKEPIWLYKTKRRSSGACVTWAGGPKPQLPGPGGVPSFQRPQIDPRPPSFQRPQPFRQGRSAERITRPAHHLPVQTLPARLPQDKTAQIPPHYQLTKPVPRPSRPSRG